MMELHSEFLSQLSVKNAHIRYQDWLELELESTRQALAETKAQLEALKNAVKKAIVKLTDDTNGYHEGMEILVEAIGCKSKEFIAWQKSSGEGTPISQIPKTDTSFKFNSRARIKGK